MGFAVSSLCRLWNDVFNMSQDIIGLPRGTIRHVHKGDMQEKKETTQAARRSLHQLTKGRRKRRCVVSACYVKFLINWSIGLFKNNRAFSHLQGYCAYWDHPGSIWDGRNHLWAAWSLFRWLSAQLYSRLIAFTLPMPISLLFGYFCLTHRLTLLSCIWISSPSASLQYLLRCAQIHECLWSSIVAMWDTC